MQLYKIQFNVVVVFYKATKGDWAGWVNPLTQTDVNRKQSEHIKYYIITLIARGYKNTFKQQNLKVKIDK